MANTDHLQLLRQGVDVWNSWVNANPFVRPDLSDAILIGADLGGAKLFWADLGGANLSKANLTKAYLEKANLSEAYLMGANLTDANLSGANLSQANLTQATLFWADLSYARLFEANFTDAKLNGADLSRTIAIEANFERANISNCRIFGVSAWKINTQDLKQANLIITERHEPEITVDNLEVAQFIYLLLRNEKLRDVISTITMKSVLILGRFTPERKAILDAIRDELRRRNYLPIVFDFENSDNRDLTETLILLAGLSRFVIADLSDPNSIPHELMSFAEKLLSVPVKPIFCATKEHRNPYPMFEDHLGRFPHVLPILRYKTADELISRFTTKIIEPAERRANKLRPARRR